MTHHKLRQRMTTQHTLGNAFADGFWTALDLVRSNDVLAAVANGSAAVQG